MNAQKSSYPSTNTKKVRYEAIVIGVSAGGMEALKVILSEIPGSFYLPIFVVQHIHPHSDNFLARYLDENSALHVKEADDKESIIGGTVYIAPPNYHLLIEENKSLALSIFEKVSYARPSIDVLFESAADVYAEKLIGIILTGANNDGSAGLRRIKEKGGLTIVQDPATAEACTMPGAALKATKIDYVLKLNQIAPFLINLDNAERKLQKMSF
jgi:two-component system chemotaxis response regulator CheB